MELLNNLMLGFGVAFTPENLAYALLGCLLGTLIGVLPGLGPAPPQRFWATFRVRPLRW